MDIEEHKPRLGTPLLPESQHGATDSTKGLDKDNILREVKKQLLLAGPLVLVNLLTFCIQTISVMFVGHLGELPLSGASLAASFATVTGFSLLSGMASALDTLCGQSYGAKQYHMLGVHMQIAMLALLLLSIPLAIIWANAGNILLFVGQDPEISMAAGVYIRFMIPSIFAYAISQALVRFLQTQTNVTPMMIISGTTTLLHIFICWMLVFQSGLEKKGAALANAISYWINALLLAIYVKVSPSCKKTWTGFSKEAFHGIPRFLGLAIPSSIMICLEWWSYEMMVLLSGLLPNPELETSVLSISLNTATIAYMIPFGLGGAVSTRVSNELGAGKPKAVRRAVIVALCIVVSEATLTAAIMLLGRDLWGYCYSNEEEVVKYVGEMLFLLAISHYFEGVQAVLSGTARGCGWQKIAAIANLGAYYILGIPMSLLLGFVYHLGGKGLWMGTIVAAFAQASSYLMITLCTHWDKEAKKAADRVYNTLITEDVIS